jgi:hypothetical protein
MMIKNKEKSKKDTKSLLRGYDYSTLRLNLDYWPWNTSNTDVVSIDTDTDCIKLIIKGLINRKGRV